MKYFLSILFIASFMCSLGQGEIKSIEDLVDKEIVTENGWAGEGFILVREDDEFNIIRKIYGSGIPVVNIVKYKPTFNSDNQITFSEPFEQQKDGNVDLGSFTLKIVEGVPELYFDRDTVKILMVKENVR